MIFAAVLALTVLGCFLFRRAITAHPGLLYGFALVVDAAYLAADYLDAPYWLWSPLFVLVQKCLLSLALFTVVMYIGCFARTSRVALWLRPVRAELSIAACLLAAGHMAAYLGTYLSRLFMGSARSSVMVAFAIALGLLVLLLVLGVTSLQGVKRRMSADRWKAVQRWAYPFFGLIYVHLSLMLAPSALGGGASAQESLAVYTAVFGVYAVARIYRAVVERPPRTAQKAESSFATDELQEISAI